MELSSGIACQCSYWSGFNRIASTWILRTCLDVVQGLASHILDGEDSSERLVNIQFVRQVFIRSTSEAIDGERAVCGGEFLLRHTDAIAEITCEAHVEVVSVSELSFLVGFHTEWCALISIDNVHLHVGVGSYAIAFLVNRSRKYYSFAWLELILVGSNGVFVVRLDFHRCRTSIVDGLQFRVEVVGIELCTERV